MGKREIVGVTPGSPAWKAGIRPGEKLLSVNGKELLDVLDYKFHTYDAELSLVVEGEDGERTVSLTKGEGEDLGLDFETYLMDKARSCANRCVFCFVDQLPRGMRDTLYFKDDDSRLSFLMGNYITLTNLSEREIQRICDLHISPINISVHATEPELRALLLGHRDGGRGLEIMKRLAEAGITMNCQIVACPGLNDGEHLLRTMEDLEALYPEVNSVSVVPVGLTKHREGLYPLTPYDREKAASVSSGYIPDPDQVMESGSGICFDYASLAASMLRSQGVPVKIIFGYVGSEGDLYHAWNMYYTEESGWVSVEFEVGPDDWNRMDLTFSANGEDSDFIGDGSNYTEVFIY